VADNIEILGFDLGHGETALAFTTLAAIGEPQALAIHNRPTVLSVVGVDKEGGVSIGDHALRRSGQLAEMHARFKSLPPLAGEWPGGRALRMFVAGVVHELVASAQVPRLEAARVFVGVPSGWETEADGPRRLQIYREALEEGGLRNITFVPESRAAFMYARESGELQVELEQLAGRVLVVDLGSSTADFTLVEALSPLPLDFGHNALGAALLEETLFRVAVDAHEDAAKLRDLYARQPARRTSDELRWRTLKEDYFNAESSGGPDPSAGNVFLFDLGGGRSVVMQAVVDRAAMEHALCEPQPVLDGLGWRDAYRDGLQAARRAIGGDPDLVLLTGGASRMGFVPVVAHEVFPGARVLRGKAPELAIGKGLAWWGRVKLRSAAFTREVELLCVPVDAATPSALGSVVRDALPALLDTLAPALAERLADEVIIPWAKAWRNHDLATLRDFEQKTGEQAAAWIESERGRDAIRDVVQAWLPHLSRELENLTDPICDRYRIPRRALVVEPTTHVSGEMFVGRTVGSIDLSHLQGFATLVNLIVAAVVGTLVGGSGKALLIAGPVGWGIGFIGTLVLLFAGQGAVREVVKNWDLPATARRLLISEERLARKAREGLPEMAGTLRTDLDAQAGPALAEAIEVRIKAALLSRAEDALVRLA
jgi:hypothetical protein